MKSLVNRLNWCERHKGEIIKHLKDKADNLEADKRIRAWSMRPIFEHLLDFEKISLWNPVDEDGNPVDTESRLLAQKDVDRLQKGRATNYKKGGNTIFRLHLVCYGIANKFIERNVEAESGELVTIGEKTQKAIKNGEYDGELLKCAQEYHKEKRKQRKKRQAEKEDESESLTVEDYISGEVDLSDIEDTETLNSWYESDKLNGGQKAAITKRKKQL
jgi:hypothetical protein